MRTRNLVDARALRCAMRKGIIEMNDRLFNADYRDMITDTGETEGEEV